MYGKPTDLAEIEDPFWLNPFLISQYSFCQENKNDDKVNKQRQQFIKQVLLYDHICIEHQELDAQQFKPYQYVDSSLINYLERMIALSAETQLLRDRIMPSTEQKGNLKPSSLTITLELNNQIILLIEHILKIYRLANAFYSESNFVINNQEEKGIIYFASLTTWFESLGLSAKDYNGSSLKNIQEALNKLIYRFEAIYITYQNPHLLLSELFKKINELIDASENFIHFMLSVLRLTVNTEPFTPPLNYQSKVNLINSFKKRIQDIKPFSSNKITVFITKIKELITISEDNEVIKSLAFNMIDYVLPEDKTQSISTSLIPLLIALYTTPLKNHTATAFDNVIQHAINASKKTCKRKEFIFILLHFLLSLQLEIPYAQNLLSKITQHLYKEYIDQLDTHQKKIIAHYDHFIKISYSKNLGSTLKSVLKDTPKILLTEKQRSALFFRIDTSDIIKTAGLIRQYFNLDDILQKLQHISPILGVENRKGADYHKTHNIISNFIRNIPSHTSSLAIKKDQKKFLITELQSLIDAEDQIIFSENPGIMVKLFFNCLLSNQINLKPLALIIGESNYEFLETLLKNVNSARNTELSMVTTARNYLAELLALILNDITNINSKVDFINDLSFLLSSKLNYTWMDNKDYTIRISPRISLDFLQIGHGFYSAMSYQDLIFNFLLALDRVAMRESSCFKEVPMIAELALQTLFLLGLEDLKQCSITDDLQTTLNSIKFIDLKRKFGSYFYAVITQNYSLKYFYFLLNNLIKNTLSFELFTDRFRPFLFEYLFCKGGLIFLSWLKIKKEFNAGQAQMRFANIHLIKMTDLVIYNELSEKNLRDRVEAFQYQWTSMIDSEEKKWSAFPRNTSSGLQLVKLVSPSNKNTISKSSIHTALIKIPSLSSQFTQSSRTSNQLQIPALDDKTLPSLTEAVSSITGGQDLCDIVMQSLTFSMTELIHHYTGSSLTATSELPSCGWVITSSVEKFNVFSLVESLLESCWQTYLIWDKRRANSEAQRKIGWLLVLPLHLDIKIKMIIKIINTRADLNLKQNIHILIQRMVNKFLDLRKIREARELVLLYLQLRSSVPEINNNEIKKLMNSSSVQLNAQQILILLDEWPANEQRLNSKLLFIMILPEEGNFKTTAKNKAHAALHIILHDPVHQLLSIENNNLLKKFFDQYFQDTSQKTTAELIPEAKKLYSSLLKEFRLFNTYNLLTIFFLRIFDTHTISLAQVISEYSKIKLPATSSCSTFKKNNYNPDYQNKNKEPVRRASIGFLFNPNKKPKPAKKTSQDDCLNSLTAKRLYL